MNIKKTPKSGLRTVGERRKVQVPTSQTKAALASTDLLPRLGPERLIELRAFGVNLMGDSGLPLMILRDESGDLSLPVPLSPMDAGLALSQSNMSARPSSPHRGTALIFKSLGLKITQAVFEEIRQQKQYLRVFFKGHPSESSLLMPAEDIMTLCFHLEVPIYASSDFIKHSQQLVSDLQILTEGLRNKAGVLKRNHTFIQ